MRGPKLKSRYVCSAIRVKLLDGRFKKTQYSECENPVSYKRKTRVREAIEASVLKDPHEFEDANWRKRDFAN
jgi:hypothetical protein